MNRLSRAERAQIIRMLVEGNSIRSVSRMTGNARNTITTLLVDLGKACAAYQDRVVRNLTSTRIECDEIWAFCYAKARNVPEDKRGEFGYGDVWTWTAIDPDTKLVPSWLVGMADDRMAALELLRKAAGDGDLDFLRDGLAMLSQLVMDAEVSARIGATHGERVPERRLTQRNGYRERRWDTRVGTIDLHIPKLRDGTYFPSLLEPRRRAERALLAVVQEAYVGGVSTRRVEELVGALGIVNLSKSEVSRICAGLDAEVDAFRSRPLDPSGYPYVSLDALYHKVREGGRVVSMATLIAIGISATGERTVLGLDVAAAGGDEGAHWLPFLRSLTARGLTGVRLVISDAHPGLVAAVEATFLGAAWQRCRVHATRNALGLVAKAAQGMVASAIRSIFEQPDEASARAQLRRVADGLRSRFPKVAELLERAEDDLLAHFTFPPAHRRQIRSTNPQERLNKEIRRRTDVVGIFPNRRSLLRLVGMLLAEQDDEWAVGRNYFSAESMALIDAPRPTEEVPPGLLIAS